MKRTLLEEMDLQIQEDIKHLQRAGYTVTTATPIKTLVEIKRRKLKEVTH